jgi:DAK2 domain fusion protein YloV
VDGQGLKDLIWAGLAWLRHHQEMVNALNVFPVPDGDTGTNMVLTMQSAWDEIAGSAAKDVGEIAHGVAHGALMGARGNSGVILSQIWRGFSHGLEGEAVLGGNQLARALEEGVDTAYRGVIRPVEGTILTVIRESAEEAGQAAADTDHLNHVLERTVRRAQDAVARTPEMLDVLAEAGVVDAGGQGLFIIFEGMLKSLRGESIGDDIYLPHEQEMLRAAHVDAEVGYGYDVQFIISGSSMDVLAIRECIDSMGECALVVGDESTIKVHVHVPDPGVPISYGVTCGSLSDVIVEDMEAQSKAFAVDQKPAPAFDVPVDASEIALIAVAPGDGLTRIFQSLGVNWIVAGGQTMNPSTEEILQAIQSVPNERVVVLPNNKNIIMAANQARDLSDKQVVVVPSRTIPQGISAVLAFNHQADLEMNAEAMSGALHDVQTGEITVSTRDVSLDGVAVCEGQVIGLVDDKLVAAGDTKETVTEAVLDLMEMEDLEIVTLYYGIDVSLAEAEDMVDHLQQLHPAVEFEVLDGGQPHYFYIISAE